MTALKAPKPGGGRLVLAVDDEPSIRKLLELTLAAADFAVLSFDRPQSALDELKNGLHPDVILSDVTMPGMSGFEVLRELKADPATRDIPVVIVTSKVLTPEERDILGAHATAVLSKEVLSRPDGGERIRNAIGYRH